MAMIEDKHIAGTEDDTRCICGNCATVGVLCDECFEDVAGGEVFEG